MVPIKNIFRITALAVAFLFCAGCFSGCNNSNNDDTSSAATAVSLSSSEPKKLKLPYSKAEPINPFKATSMVNRQLSALIYDCLFRVDSGFQAFPVIANDYSAEGLTITVNIKPDLAFSDGTALSADDIVYSFKQALQSPAFSSHLSNFGSVQKLSNTTLVFKLKNPDPFAVNCLDFSIIPNNNTDDSPVGSGRYIVNENNSEIILQVNSARLGGFSPKIEAISLVGIADSDSLNYSLQIGNINFVYMDLSHGSYQRINASTLEIGTNNLVYLVLNNASANLQNAVVRQAVNLLVDRESIASTSFQGHARATSTPFNPAWTSQYNFIFKPDTKAAIELLENAGFNKFKSSGVRYSGSNNSLSFTLLVNSDNAFKTEAADLIVKQLWDAGIKVTVNKLAFDEYTSAVQAGKYDMYLGEIMLTPNMSLSSLLGSGGSVTFGIDTGAGAASAAYSSFTNLSLDLKDFVDAFNADIPFIPICYRNGIAAYSRDLTVPQECNSADVFCDIYGWTFLS